MPARSTLIPIVVVSLLLAACGAGASPLEDPAGLSGTASAAPTANPPATVPATATEPQEEAIPMPFAIASSAFEHGDPIPTRFSCDGENASPPLSWGDPPEGTLSIALIMDDPDAPSGTFVHWVLYDVPAATRSLPTGVPTEDRLPDGGVQGRNGAGRTGYIGPCPPGGRHRYFFHLYALDSDLGLEPGVSKQQLLGQMDGHVLAEAELMGTYAR
jgi:Raf kinase inhibitor-like YbhB/YbcL family protein